MINFNSTMVRLKVTPTMVGATMQAFQFHYGTIKSDNDFLKRFINFISIPLWYD